MARRLTRATSAGRRAWPVILMAWERWQSLPEHERERYRRQARAVAERGRRVLEGRRGGGGRRRP
jgi:hypothetical protein